MTETNWSSPPGDTIARLLNSREIDSSELASALGLSNTEFDELIAGRRRLTEADAFSLAANLGSTPRFWLSRDAAYVVDMARLDVPASGAEAAWLASMPVSSMRKYGWVSKGVRAKDRLTYDLLAFFGCTTLAEWGQRYSSGVGAVAFRTSVALESDGMATLVWLRAGERALAGLGLPKFDSRGFRKLITGLKKLSAFKRPAVFLPRLVEACRAVGVAVATARTPDGCRASGASWFGPSGNPVILLSFRHLAEDHFWFTFFHEAGHVLLHGKNHIDGDGGQAMGTETGKQEDEANAFAQEILLADDLRDSLREQGIQPKSIVAIAREAEVTPGIIVGQLQRVGLVDHSKMNFLKRRYRWGNSPNVPDLVA